MYDTALLARVFVLQKTNCLGRYPSRIPFPFISLTNHSTARGSQDDVSRREYSGDAGPSKDTFAWVPKELAWECRQETQRSHSWIPVKILLDGLKLEVAFEEPKGTTKTTSGSPKS